MTRLVDQAQGIINVCQTVLAGQSKDLHTAVDNQTIAIAPVILAEAKAALPDDKVLAAVDLKPPVSSWTTLQSAMETVISSLATEDQKGLVVTTDSHRVDSYRGAHVDRQRRFSLRPLL